MRIEVFREARGFSFWVAAVVDADQACDRRHQIRCAFALVTVHFLTFVMRRHRVHHGHTTLVGEGGEVRRREPDQVEFRLVSLALFQLGDCLIESHAR
jgi:hypothetical protein